MCFIMHVVLEIVLSHLGKLPTYILILFTKNQHSSLGRVFLLLFLTTSAFSKSFNEYQFIWNSGSQSFTFDGNSSPNIILYEHCSYLIRSLGAEFSISEDNITHYSGNEIFFNQGVQGDGEYILLTPNQSTPRKLYYQNLNDPSSRGTFEIKGYENVGLLRMNQPEAFANLGANVVLSDDLTLFASAPGFREKEGLVIRSSIQNDGTFIHESNIPSPTEEKTFWGSSLYFDNNQSQLLIGSPNSADFRGSLHSYSSSTSETKLLFMGENIGDLLGWSFSTHHDKLLVSALSVTDPTGGYFSVFSNAYSNRLALHENVRSGYPVFGNEYGYDVSIFDNLIAIGAPGEDDLTRQDCGAVYLYRLEENNLKSYKILSSIRNDGDRFGHSVTLDNGFMFVGAPSGDGSSTKSGLVHIFDCKDEDFTDKEIFRILPPNEGAAQNFSQDISVVGDFVFISSPGTEEVGAVYVFRRYATPDSDAWVLVNSIPLSLFSDDLRSTDKIAIDAQNGVLAIGMETESSNEIEAGAVLILRNPAWNVSSQIIIPPFFRHDSPSAFTIEEDSSVLTVDFNASLPPWSNAKLFWEINSSSALITIEDYDINSTTGVFNFTPPANLSGIISFTLAVQTNNQRVQHDFSITINSVSDEPYFEDFNTADDITQKLPAGAVNQHYSYFFHLNDPDVDDINDLNLTLVGEGELPSGLRLIPDSTGLFRTIEGTPDLNSTYVDRNRTHTFVLSLSDGKGNDISQSFSIQIFPENNQTICIFRGDKLESPASINLNFSENFSLKDWENEISELNITDSDGLDVRVINLPASGFLFPNNDSSFTKFSDYKIRYIPEYNFNGNVSWGLRFKDNHPVSPELFDLYFNLDISSVNTPPHIDLNVTNFLIAEGEFFESSFHVFDADEDLFTVSIKNAPDWLKFDGVRRIYGKPSRNDFKENGEFFFITVTDQWGGSTSQKVSIEIDTINKPPIITIDDEQVSVKEFSINEDSGSFIFEIAADDPDGNSSLLDWEIDHRLVEIDASDTNKRKLFFEPESNFSGLISCEVKVFETLDPLAYDKINLIFNVNPLPDPPKFETFPYPGVVLNRPWFYHIRGFDADLNDHLILEYLEPRLDWLKFAQTGTRQWTFSGFPTELADDVDVHLRLSDGNTTVEQKFSLKVINSVEDLILTESSGVEFTNLGDSLLKKSTHIDLIEDSNWSIDTIKVNAIDEIRINWSITEFPTNGSVKFAETGNGEIQNLSYVPDENFNGSDLLVLEVTDNYSTLELRFTFNVIKQEDPLVFLEIPNGIVEDEDEFYDFLITFEDGDGIDNLKKIEFLTLPNWLLVSENFSSQFKHSLRVSGEPSVNDIGLHDVNFIVTDNEGLDHLKSFKINVRFLNKPPVLSPTSIYTTIDEDSHNDANPKIWIEPFTVSDVESSEDQMTWSIFRQPFFGSAGIDEDGDKLFYFPDANYSGEDSFLVGVLDSGGSNNSLPRQAIAEVNISVNQLNDLPFFSSLPPSHTNETDVITWYDEKTFSYLIEVKDSDWNWQGYPKISLLSNLPQWVSFLDLGEGRALLSGTPKWFHQGKYSFTIEARSGTDKITQKFDLKVVVDDFPPLVMNASGQTIYSQIQLFVLEDGNLDDVRETVMGLYAYNPDKKFGETLRWLSYKQPLSGGHISLTSYKDEINDFALIADFNYSLPMHFNGADKFSILVDEGDKTTEVPFEINVKSIPDPPEFIDDNLTFSLGESGSYIQFEVTAFEPDGQPLEFKILHSTPESKWISLKEKHIHDSVTSLVIGGVIPKNNINETITVVAADPTGRFDLLPIKLLSTEDN
jgi:hypothetical protein